jgi:hypothetical protein
VTLAPGIPDLSALGAQAPCDVLGQGGELAMEARAHILRADREARILRIPLPGTPDANGRMQGAPRGAGTGWIHVRRYHDATTCSWVKARFTHPRSESLAAREWNLLCHLRAAGVATPEPMALVEVPAVLFANHSCLVTRELEDSEPLLSALAGADASERVHLLRAVSSMLARLFRSNTYLKRFRSRHLYVSRSGTQALLAEDACAAEQILAVQATSCGNGPVAGMDWGKLPEIVVASVRSGRILPALKPKEIEVMLRGLAIGVYQDVTPRERLRLLLSATRGLFSAVERRALRHRLLV